MRPELIVITGPTATGKTKTGVVLAKKINGEVVSADSMQIYRRMSIGTAKPTKEEMEEVPHHMLDIAEPDEDYSVARYVEAADRAVRNILDAGRVPILVGGTGLYIDSLLSGRTFAASPCADPQLRTELDAQYMSQGGAAMLERLRAIDPERAEKLHPADRKRILRALEVYILTGKTITRHDEETQKLPPRYRACKAALSFADRAALYDRIDRRVDEMMEQGLRQEVKALLREGIPPACTAMQAIGYKEIVSALQGESSMEAAVEEVKRASRRYAKRQLTWLRRDATVRWILWEKTPDPEMAAETILRWTSEG